MPTVQTHLSLILLCLLGSTVQAAPYSYATHALQLTDLGAGVNPTAINNVGQVVGQAANSQAFLWANGTMAPLGTVGGTQSYANDINDNGVAVGWSLNTAGATKPFRWDSVNGMTNIGAASTADSVAEAINNQNQIIGWRTNGTLWKTTLWDLANPNGRTLFNGQGDHKGLGINDAGYIVGVTVTATGNADEGYYWNNIGGGTNYTSGLGTDYFPFAGINQTNLTAGIQGSELSYLQIGVDSNPHEGSSFPTDPFSIANGLNDLGQLVGESHGKGALYQLADHQLLDLNLFPRITPGFGQVLSLTDINNTGAFTGVALIDGVEHGIVGQFVPVPEPASWVLIGVGLAAVCLTRRRPTR